MTRTCGTSKYNTLSITCPNSILRIISACVYNITRLGFISTIKCNLNFRDSCCTFSCYSHRAAAIYAYARSSIIVFTVIAASSKCNCKTSTVKGVRILNTIFQAKFAKNDSIISCP